MPGPLVRFYQCVYTHLVVDEICASVTFFFSLLLADDYRHLKTSLVCAIAPNDQPKSRPGDMRNVFAARMRVCAAILKLKFHDVRILLAPFANWRISKAIRSQIYPNRVSDKARLLFPIRTKAGVN